jgi:hypothetical protein
LQLRSWPRLVQAPSQRSAKSVARSPSSSAAIV